MTPLTRTTPWEFRLLGAPPRIYVSVHFVFGIIFMGSLGISDSPLSTCLSGSRIDLSTQDNIIALALAKCPPRPYAELIKSDLNWPFELQVCSLCCFEAFAPFLHESVSPWAFRCQTHQGRAFGLVGDAVSEAPECEKENPRLR